MTTLDGCVHLALYGAMVLLTWVILWIVLTAVGRAILRTLRIEGSSPPAVLPAWIGLAGLIGYLQLWNLAEPTGPVAWVPVLALAAWELLRLGGARRFLESRPTAPRWLDAVLVLVTLWLVERSLGPIGNFDTGMYHLPAMIWAERYRIVPGLANLHGRLAFNNAGLLFAALLDRSLWFTGASHVFNGFFLFLLLLEAYRASARATRSTFSRAAFAVSFLGPIFVLGSDPAMVSSLAPDVGAGAVVLVGLMVLVRALAQSHDTDARYADLTIAAILLSLAPCLKLSTGFVALFAWLAALSVLLRRGRRRNLVIAGACSLLIGGPWLIRGVISSGYLLYPSPLLSLPVSWRVPLEQARAESAWVTYFSHWGPHDSASTVFRRLTTHSWNWLRPWKVRLLHNVRFRGDITDPFLLSVLLFADAAISGRDRRGLRRAFRMWPAVLALAIGGVAWFFIAPRARFAPFIFWGMVAVAAASWSYARPKTLAPPLLTIALLCAGVGTFQMADGIYTALRHGTPALTAVAQSVFVAPAQRRRPAPAEVSRYTTASGLRLYVPVKDNRCMAAPLPCTPHPQPSLRLRGAGLQDGFVAGPEWEPLDFPNVNTGFLEGWRRAQAHLAR